MNCRICGASNCIDLGKFQPYSDYSTEVYNCTVCGCRFVRRDETIYEELHSQTSSYSAHAILSDRAEQYFNQKNKTKLREFLRTASKNRFVIESIESDESIEKVLEIGCSRGYLAAYFVLGGWDIVATDISVSAIDAARNTFGDYFYLAGDPIIKKRSPYDAIFHVGTIGCVEDPIQEIENQLELLRPGGILIFNAPNLDFCRKNERVWVQSTTPPDLVTLFPPQFWQETFRSLAHVYVEVQELTLKDWIVLTKLERKSRRFPQTLFPAKKTVEKKTQSLLKNVIRVGARSLLNGLSSILALRFGPSEFGVFVKMTKL